MVPLCESLRIPQEGRVRGGCLLASILLKPIHPAAEKEGVLGKVGFRCDVFSEVSVKQRPVASCLRGEVRQPAKKRLERSAAVSAEDNEAVVRRWIEAYNDRNRQAEADLLAPEYVAHVPGARGPLDSEAWTQFTAPFVEAFPDLRLTVEDIFSVGEKIAARVAFHGITGASSRASRRPARK